MSTRPVRPGRLAVRADPEKDYPEPGKCYTIVSTIELPGYSESTTGRFPGLWCLELYGWEFAQKAALEDAKSYADELAAEAAKVWEPSS